MLLKARSTGDVAMLHLLLGQIELATGLEPGRTGIEVQIEDANGPRNCEAIAAACADGGPAFGPGDFSAAIGIPTTTGRWFARGVPWRPLNAAYEILIAARWP